MTIDRFDALFFSYHLLSVNDDELIKNYIEIFFPKGLSFSPPLVTFYKDSIEGYYNFFITQKNVIFLPNWISEIIQIFGNQHINLTTLRKVQEWSFGFLNKFRILCEIRAALWWWLMFNPYQQPFNTLRILTEWYLTALTGIFPIIIGIDIGPTIAITILGVILDFLNRLVFTMPYLPSEGEKFTIATLDQLNNSTLADLISKIGEDVTVFRFLPSLWYKYSIPNSLREYWYEKKPEILQYFLKSYGNLGVDFVPDRILQSQKNHQILVGSQIDFSNISSNFIVSIKKLSYLHDLFTS